MDIADANAATVGQTPPEISSGKVWTGQETFGDTLDRTRKQMDLTWRVFADRVNEILLPQGKSVSFTTLQRWGNNKTNATKINSSIVAACDQVCRTGDALQKKLEAVKQSIKERSGVSSPTIPAAPTRFVGRERELGELNMLLGHTPATPRRRVIITGEPGVGKTAVARQWYHCNQHALELQYPGGAAWVDLHGYDKDAEPLGSDEALESILQQLGTPPHEIPAHGTRRTQALARLCAQQPVLLLLDNAADSEHVAKLISGIDGKSAVVITSRTQLSRLVSEHDAHVVTLKPLTDSEAQQFLADRVGPRILVDPDAAYDVANYCDRIPLALNIASGFLAEHPHHPVRDLAARLAQEEQRLDTLAVERLGVRGAFSLSYRALAPQSRRLFRLLGLHPGAEISADAAAALAGGTVPSITEELTILSNACLVEEISPHRFRFHDLLRVFAAECARQEETETARTEAIDRLLQHYRRHAAAVAVSLSPDLRLPAGVDPAPLRLPAYSATQWQVTERTNLLGAAQLANKHGYHRMPWHLAVLQGTEVTDGRTAWQAAHLLGLRVAEKHDDHLGAAWCMHNLAVYHCTAHEYSLAQTYLEQADLAWQRIEDRHGQAWTAWAQAHLLAETGHPFAALKRYQRILNLDIDDDYLRATVQASMGFAYNSLPEPDWRNAQDLFIQAKNYFTSLRVPAGTADTLTGLAYTYQGMGDYKTALKRLKEAYSLYVIIQAQTRGAGVLLHQARIHKYLGNLQDASELAEEALDLFTEHDDPREEDAAAFLETLVDIEL